MEIKTHQFFMQAALQLAQAAFEADEVPVGCVITLQDRIIGAAHNQREMLKDPTAHAEILAITQAANAIGDWRLENCSMYVTLEPCPMCAGAIVQARIPNLIYGASDPKAGACQSLFQLTSDQRLNHQAQVMGGIMSIECGAILSEFFQNKRRLGKK